MHAADSIVIRLSTSCHIQSGAVKMTAFPHYFAKHVMTIRPGILKALFLCAAFGIIFYSRTYESGPPAAYTNAPSEQNCAASGCHNTYSVSTSGANYSNIKLTNNFTGNGYIPDSTYTLVLQYKESGVKRFGFEMTCLDASNLACGTFGTLDTRTSTTTTSVGGKTRYYIYQTYTGSSPVSTDSAAYKIKWTAPKTNVGNVKFYVTFNSADNNGSESNDHIYAKVFTFSPSTLIPTGKVKLQDSAACTGRNLTFKATVTGNPTSYDWSFPGGSPTSSTATTPTVTYSSSGSYKAYLTVKNSKATGSKDSFAFIVYNPPSASITPSGPFTICKGDSVKLSANTSTGFTYKWSPGNQTGSFIYAKDSTTYSVIVSASSKCGTVSNKVVVNVNKGPSAYLTSNKPGDSLCEFDSWKVKGNPVSASVDSWSFASASGPFSKVDSATNKTQVWTKGSNGCVAGPFAIALKLASKSPAPVLATDSQSLHGFRLTWNAVPGATAYFISTDSGKTWTTPGSGSQGLYHKVTGMGENQSLYIGVYATDNSFCGSTEPSFTIGRSGSCTDIPFTISTNPKACKNSNITLHIGGLKKISKGLITVNGTPTTSRMDTMPKILFGGNSTYKIGVIDSANTSCGFTFKNITVVEDTIVAPTLNTQPRMVFCTNADSMLSQVTAVKKKATDSILFYQNNNIIKRGTSNIFIYKLRNNDSIWVASKNATGCSSATSRSHVSIVKLPDAGYYMTQKILTYGFGAKTKTGKHVWTMDTISRTGDSITLDLSAYEGQNVTVIHKLKIDSCDAAFQITFKVTSNLSTRNFNKKQGLIFPNPSNGTIRVETATDCSLEIFDMQGRIMGHWQIRKGDSNPIHLDQLSDGLYLCRLSGADGSNTIQLHLQR